MRILILSPFLCHSKVGHGGGVVCYKQIKYLSEKYDVYFVSFVHASERCYSSELRKFCAEVILVDFCNSFLKRILAVLRSIRDFSPVGRNYYFSRKMSKLLVRLTHEVKFDVAIVMFPQMAQYIKFLDVHYTIMDVQDSFTLSKFRFALSTNSMFRRFWGIVNWLSWLRYEYIYYQLFNSVVTITDQDKITLQAYNPNLPVICINAAVDMPDASSRWSPIDRAIIGFLGSFDHEPNHDAVRYFVSDILPLVHSEFPNVEFIIAGKGVFSDKKCLNHPKIKFLGYVKNLYEFYQNISVSVIPIRYGGGVKIKTLESMAYGVPIVASTVAVEGINITHGVELLIADTPEDFSKNIISLLKNRSLQVSFSKKCIQHINSNYSWNARIDKLSGLFDN